MLVRTVDIPGYVPREEAKGYIYSQLQETIHLPYEDPVIDVAFLEGTSSTLLFAYPSSYVNQLEETLKKAKVKGGAAEVSFLSLYRYFEQTRDPAEEEHLLFVDWNMDGVCVTAYHQGIPRFSRFMKADLPKDVWKVREQKDGVAFKADQDKWMFIEEYIEDQITELNKLMNFYRYSVSKEQQPVTRIVVSGDFPELQNVYEAAGRSLGVPVEFLSQGALLNGMPFKYADVTGLSYRDGR